MWQERPENWPDGVLDECHGAAPSPSGVPSRPVLTVLKFGSPHGRDRPRRDLTLPQYAGVSEILAPAARPVLADPAWGPQDWAVLKTGFNIMMRLAALQRSCQRSLPTVLAVSFPPTSPATKETHGRIHPNAHSMGARAHRTLRRQRRHRKHDAAGNRTAVHHRHAHRQPHRCHPQDAADAR